MSNTIKVVDWIAREAARVLHQKSNFIQNINTSYDSQWDAAGGAKPGDTIRMRLPPKFTVTTAATFSAQDYTERSTPLARATQKHIGVEFTSEELTQKLDTANMEALNRLSETKISPAMAQLAASVEADALTIAYKATANSVGTPGSNLTYDAILDGMQRMDEVLTPRDDLRCCTLSPRGNRYVVSALKGLFHSSDEISEQYKTGLMGMTAGMKFYSNSMMPRHTVGIATGTPLVNGASQTGASLVTDGWTNSQTGILKAGDVFTIAGVYDVHPETKTAYTHLKQFVVTADANSGASTGPATLSISPSIVTTGALQNVSAGPADDAAITVVGTGSTAHGVNLAYHRDSFAFATAKLYTPSGSVEMAANGLFEGINIRFLRQFDGRTDTLIQRFDVLYGAAPLLPETAVRIHD